MDEYKFCVHMYISGSVVVVVAVVFSVVVVDVTAVVADYCSRCGTVV